MKKILYLVIMTIVVVTILLLAIFDTMASSQSQTVVNIPVGRSWPRSITINSVQDVVYVDAVSGFYPPAGFSFEVYQRLLRSDNQHRSVSGISW